jgi:thiol-disulfide isomerase/thioredoxin
MTDCQQSVGEATCVADDPRGRILISTVEDWTKWKQTVDNDDNKKTILLQLGAEWCQHCHPVGFEIAKKVSDYQFHSLYTDARDSELFEHFQCTKLPALVFYKPGDDKDTMIESVRVNTVAGYIRDHCDPKLVLDTDF